jgi:exonuclease SbcD
VAEAEGEDSDSERTLLVGGAAYVPSQIFEFFNYTALGHLHKPLSFLDGKVKYSGSLMKYSFSEAAYDKSVIMLEITQNGNFTHERIKIIPKKEVRRVKGEIIQKEFILKDDSTPQKEDFLEVSLLNTEIVANAMQIVQRAYPNTMVLKWPELPKIMNTSRLTTEQVVSMSEIELFEDFYKNFTEKELDNDKKQVIKEVISGIKKIED